MALIGSNFLGSSWVKSGLLRAASKNARSRPPERSEPLRQARGGSGRRCAYYSPFWLCARTKVGASGVGLTAEGDNDALAGPSWWSVLHALSTYSPGAPQSNGSPACAVVSRLMSTHARVGEAIRRHRAHCTALHDSESSTDPRARPGHPKA